MKDTDNKYVQALIKDSQYGNKNSFKQLIDLYIGITYLFCYRMMFNQETAEEITKDVFKIAWKNIKKIRSDVSFASWIMGFTVFEIIQKIKKNTEVTKSKQKKIPEQEKTLDPTLSTFEKLIFKLDDNERRFFLLHDIKKYSYEEIADLFTDYSKDEINNSAKSAREKLARGLFNEL
jgi:RNA polymerase sigma-70 factor, ECF subfamily